MANGHENRQLPRLPACQSCYTKKAKCDNARPKCSPCMRNGHACLTVSLNGSEPVSREYINELEQKALSLQAGVIDIEPLMNDTEEHSPEDNDSSGPAPRDSLRQVAETTDGRNSDMSLSPNYVEGAGISFMSLLFTDPRWREQNQKLLHNLSKRATILETSVQKNSLPSAEEALIVFNSYLGASHVQNPFLLRRYVQDLYQALFPESLEDQHARASGGRSTEHQLFRAFMILAIGAIPLYRAGKHQYHPYGYFLSALKHLEEGFLLKGLESIQDLLLVSRFGIYYHIGTSIWELIQLSTRMCIEQGLHRCRTRKTPDGHLLEEQLRRRVFWQCYMMDRYTSVMLDRPPAVADKDIQVGFPADADDEELELAGQSGVFADLDSFYRISTVQMDSMPATETSVFLFCLRLRKITSKIHTKFQQKTKGIAEQEISQIELASASGTIYLDLDELLNELESWRVSAPVFSNPKCLYERQEWYDLLLMRERLLIIRKAIDLVPKRNNVPPRDLLGICLEYSVGTITTFCAMFDQGLVTYTRSYFQTLFTAGLSVMFCVSVVEDLDYHTIKSASEAVKKGEKTLKLMVQELPDAVHYVALYEALRADILRKTKNQRPDAVDGEQHIPFDTINQSGSIRFLPDGSVNTENEPPAPDIQHNPPWPILTPDASTNEAQLIQLQEVAIESQQLSWDIFGDNVFWSMEADMLGEYVYGSSAAGHFFD
ncbi:Zn(II)2Cys6 transcription factor, partial [Aspergillus vadensis CBS 113365]